MQENKSVTSHLRQYINPYLTYMGETREDLVVLLSENGLECAGSLILHQSSPFQAITEYLKLEEAHENDQANLPATFRTT